MDKKEQFKAFANKHPELVKSVQNKDTTWQQLYEIYDIYGEKEEAWSTYFNKPKTETISLSSLVKNIDVESIQTHINTAQKALGFISELTKSSGSTPNITKAPVDPRPITKFFGD